MVNYRVARYKRVAEPIFWRLKPNDEHRGWEQDDNGILEPIQCYGPDLPESSVDLLVGGISLDDGGVEEMEMDSDGWRVEE